MQGESSRPWQMTPRAVMLLGAFWTAHRGFLSRLALGLLGAWLLWPLIFPDQRAAAMIGGARLLTYAAPLLFLLLPYGALRALRALEEIYTNHRLAEHIILFTRQKMPSVQAPDAAPPEVEKLEEELLGSIAIVGRGDPAMLRLCRALSKNAAERRFDPVEVLLRPYREEARAPLEGMDSLQRMALRLGILGAFIGLLYAIGAIPLLLAKMQDQRAQGDADLLWGLFQQLAFSIFAGLAIKFGSSVAGLYVAVVLAMLSAVVRRKCLEYQTIMETAAGDFGLLAQRCKLDSTMQSAIDRVHADLTEHKERQSQLLSYVRDLTTSVDAHRAAVAAGMAALTTLHAQHSVFMKELAGQQTTFVHSMGEVYDSVTLSKQLLAQHQALLTLLRHSGETLTTIAQQTAPVSWWRRLTGG